MGARSHSRRKHKTTPKKNQVPHKFAKDERVLCYEPDIKKARVLYDSKVLEVVERSEKGKIRVEYKIHFFGWNSSWDRYVAEDCVLKDTDENRELQRDLKSKADVLIQSHLKKKKRKKTLTEILKEAKEKTEKGIKSNTKDDDEKNSSGSSESSDESSDDEEKEVSRIILTDRVKALLEQDCYNIMTRNMLVRVPAEVSVICVFEGYVKFIGFRELRRVVEQCKPIFIASGLQPGPNPTASSATSKTAVNKGGPSELLTEDIEIIYRKVRQAQEIVHGLKIIFDHMLYQMLLYNVENEQYKSHRGMRPKMPDINCSQLIPKLPAPSNLKEKQHKKGDNDGEGSSSTRPVPGTSRESETLNKLRKHTKAADESLGASYETWLKTVNKYILELTSWQMLPEECYQKEHPDPSMVYGLIHLLRFFVKLPDILTLMHIPRRKVRIIAHHVNQMLDHIQSSYVFSLSRLYVGLPRYVYEEDQIKLAPAVTDEGKIPEVKIDPNPNWSQYCTKNHRLVPITRVKPPLAKVVEVPLSTTGDALVEEHQLTIRTEAPIQANFGRAGKEGRRISNTKKLVPPNLTSKLAPPEEKGEDDVKQEPLSPALPPPKVTPQASKKSASASTSGSISPSPPVLPMIRQIRKSAAHAAFKTAHMFASQQTLTSRTIAASTSTLIKQEVKDTNEERDSSKKRDLSSESPVSESKRITRTGDVRTEASGGASSKPESSSGVRKSRQKKRRIRQLKPIEPTDPRFWKPPRKGYIYASDKETDTKSGLVDSEKDTKEHMSGGNGQTSGAQSQCKDRDRSLSPEKSKIAAKRISSPRSSKASTSSKDGRPIHRTPQKSTSPTSTIRLRSRSDERQLRSKGALINALALPMHTSPRTSYPTKSEEDRSPRRRDSTGNRDSGSGTGIIASSRLSEPIFNRRPKRK